MLANCCTKETALFDAATLTLDGTGAGKLRQRRGGMDAASERPAADGRCLRLLLRRDGTNSEIYDPATGTWSSAGSTIVQLWDSFRTPTTPHTSRPRGAAARRHGLRRREQTEAAPAAANAIYDTNDRHLDAGPDFPHEPRDVADGPAALLPNGNVLVQTSPGSLNQAPTSIEWNGLACSRSLAPARARRGFLSGKHARASDGRDSLDRCQRERLGLPSTGSPSRLGAEHSRRFATEQR